MENHAKLGKSRLLLEAEVPLNSQPGFEGRYRNATGLVVSPGSTGHYQDQPNKWGAELRAYFNDPGLSDVLKSFGIRVEFPRKGYMAGEYQFRFNDNDLWWKLVEVGGLRLGTNNVVVDDLLLLIRPDAV